MCINNFQYLQITIIIGTHICMIYDQIGYLLLPCLLSRMFIIIPYLPHLAKRSFGPLNNAILLHIMFRVTRMFFQVCLFVFLIYYT